MKAEREARLQFFHVHLLGRLRNSMGRLRNRSLITYKESKMKAERDSRPDSNFFMCICSEGLRNSIGRLRNRSLITLLMMMIMMASAGAMRFDLQSGSSKCIAEDINSNAMTVGKYTVINPLDGYPLPDSHKTTVRVTSPYGYHYHSSDSVESGDFAFTANEGGDYMTCFWAPDHKPPFTLSIDFDWKTGFAAKDWSKVAKKDQIEEMELELMKLLDTVTSIHDEMYYLREREEEMQVLNRATNSKMATFSFLSIFVCLSVAGLQLWHLKTFFERKKLI